VLSATTMDAAKVSLNLGLREIQLAAPSGRVLIQQSSATIGPGVTSLTGSNGAGKSTLLRALATLHPLAGGSVILNGTEIQRDSRAFLEQSVYLPQNFATYPELTGREFLEYSLRLRGAGRQEARAASDAWLDTVGLRAASKSKTGAYSQGMRQRLGFAYAMQLDVSLYLLDEPFAGVDPESRHALTDLLFRLAADRIAIVSTHHVEEMYARGSGFVRIAEGKLLQ